MGWEALRTKRIEKLDRGNFFKPAAEVEKKGIKIGVYGDPETGKTYFACSCPPPVYILDTEYGTAPVLRHFRKKEIHVYEAAYIDPKTDELDPLESIERVGQALTTLAEMKEGTIVIDTGTDIWNWIRAWLEAQSVKKTASGTVYRFEYGRANLKYRNLIMKIIAKPLNFVVTGQTRVVYDVEGRPTNIIEPRWMKQTEHWVDVLIHTKKIEEKSGRTRYFGIIRKCRWQRAFNLEIEDITYDKLVQALKEKLDVVIR